MNINSLSIEEPCILYPWNNCDNNKMQMKATFENNYLDHMSNLKINSNTSNTITTIACSVLSDVTKDLIERYCEKGVSMVVLDFNGKSYEECQKMTYEIRQGVFNYSVKNNQVPYSLALVLDLRGNQITTGTILKSKPNQNFIKLQNDDTIYLTNDIEIKDKCTKERIYVNSNKILRLKKDDRIFLDYGKIELAVERVDPDEVKCIIIRGELLESQKVVHIPGIPIGMTALTEQDKEIVRIGIQLKVDVIMIPGIKNAGFFNYVKNFVGREKGGKDIDLYVKIDNSIGLENIDEIIQNVDGVFLHRLNLAMEIGSHRVFLAQKVVLTKCNILGKPTMTYGGFLNSLEYNTIPLSAEINDIITTVLDGTDCIYLDVTARSVHKVHCVKYASYICRQGEVAIWEQQLFSELSMKSKPKIDHVDAICIGCVTVSLKSNAASIIVITTSGLSAKKIARYRPRCPVIAIVKHGKCARKISVWRNVIAIHYIDPIETIWSKDVENRTKFAMNFAKNKSIINQGDLVIHMSCSKQNAGFTNTMRLFYTNASDFVEA